MPFGKHSFSSEGRLAICLTRTITPTSIFEKKEMEQGELQKQRIRGGLLQELLRPLSFSTNQSEEVRFAWDSGTLLLLPLVVFPQVDQERNKKQFQKILQSSRCSVPGILATLGPLVYSLFSTLSFPFVVGFSILSILLSASYYRYLQEKKDGKAVLEVLSYGDSFLRNSLRLPPALTLGALLTYCYTALGKVKQ